MESHTESPSDVVQTVTQVRSLAQRFFGRQLDQRSRLLGKRLSDTAATILELGDELEKRGRGRWIKDICGYGAAYVDRVGAYLQNSDGATFRGDYQRYARRQPVVVGGVALATGFVLSRILRVSALAQSTPLQKEDK